MAIIDVSDHSLSAEKEEIETMQSSLKTELTKMQESVRNLKPVWQDDKSEEAIAKLYLAFNEIQTKCAMAATETENYLGEVGQILKINY